MLEFLTEGDENTFTVLKADHTKAKELFDAYEKAESANEKRSIAKEAIKELKIHTLIEEEIFYPALRQHVEGKLLNEADEEHHVAKFLIAELEHIDVDHDHYDAKFKVLSENVRHHIREEEGRMFHDARNTPVDFDLLGQQLLARKEELKRDGVPEMEEDAMIGAFGTQDDSPARLARENPGTRTAKPRARAQQKKVIRLKPRSVRKAAKPVKRAKLAKKMKPAKKAAAKSPSRMPAKASARAQASKRAHRTAQR